MVVVSFMVGDPLNGRFDFVVMEWSTPHGCSDIEGHAWAYRWLGYWALNSLASMLLVRYISHTGTFNYLSNASNVKVVVRVSSTPIISYY